MFAFLELMFDAMVSCIFQLNRIAFSGVGFFQLMITVVIYDIVVANLIRRG